MTPSSLLVVCLAAIVGVARTSTGFVAPVPSVVHSGGLHPRSASSSSSSSSSSLRSHKLVLVRHGESTWNDLNIFTGWADAPLNEKGLAEAHQGGRLLREGGYGFDVAYTSVLKRAIKTLWIVLEELDLMYIPIVSYLPPPPGAARSVAHLGRREAGERERGSVDSVSGRGTPPGCTSAPRPR